MSNNGCTLSLSDIVKSSSTILNFSNFQSMLIVGSFDLGPLSCYGEYKLVHLYRNSVSSSNVINPCANPSGT